MHLQVEWFKCFFMKVLSWKRGELRVGEEGVAGYPAVYQLTIGLYCTLVCPASGYELLVVPGQPNVFSVQKIRLFKH